MVATGDMVAEVVAGGMVVVEEADIKSSGSQHVYFPSLTVMTFHVPRLFRQCISYFYASNGVFYLGPLEG